MARKGAFLFSITAALGALAVAGLAAADEGMWTFDNFPIAKVNATYGTKIDQAFLDKIQAGSVRLTTGCSASVVSPEGLVLTNHHCVIKCISDLSTPERDHVQAGFTPATRAEERQCPGMQAEVLLSIADVTERMQSAGRGETGSAFVRARDAESTRIEQEACAGEKGVRCQVVSLYRGGQFKLYKYRTYADVRLAFAPEFKSAFFGGDPDNFNFPRYALDAAFLRVYADGKPAATPQHLRVNTAAPKAGELLFISGNPGTTLRLLTATQLRTQRDLVLPAQQLQRSELRGRLVQFSTTSAEAKRLTTDPLFGVENSFKAIWGRQQALSDDALLAAKAQEEARIKAAIAGRPEAAAIGDPWADIAAVQDDFAELFYPMDFLEARAGGGSQLYAWARAIVRGSAERAKPSTERLPEYADNRLPGLARSLGEPRPVSPEIEEIYLSQWLSKAREYMTVDSPYTKALLGGRSPEALARDMARSRLIDPEFRKQLWEGGAEAVAASDDPIIQLVRRADPSAREVRSAWEQRVTGPTDNAAERIARARFLAFGDTVYPDATFTPRLSYGVVQGWTHRGVEVPPFTYVGGLFERASGYEPFELAPRWAAAKDRLDPKVPFNFSSSHDIIGGNSGSPVINARGEVVGTVFDGNIHSLGGAYFYDPVLNRAVTVTMASVVEALNKVYDQPHLVRELTGPAQPARRPARRR